MIRFNEKAFVKEPRLKIVESHNYNLDVLVNEETDIIYSSGSVIEGYGDKYSDVDIFFLCENNKLPTDDEIEIPMEGTKIGYNVEDNEDYGFYVEFILNKKQWGMDTINKINSLSEKDLDNIEVFNNLSYRERDFYYMLSIAIPLYNEGLFNEYTKDVSKNHICKIISKYYAVESSRLLSYAKLLWKDGSCEHSYYYAREAVLTAIDSYLAANNEAYKSYKLRYRKLLNVVSKDSEIYVKCSELSAIGGGEYESYIKKSIAFCEELGISNHGTLFENELTYRVNGWIDFIDIFEQYLIFNGTVLFQIDTISKNILKDLNYKFFTKNKLIQEISKYKVGNADKYANDLISYFEKYGIIKLAV